MMIPQKCFWMWRERKTEKFENYAQRKKERKRENKTVLQPVSRPVEQVPFSSKVWGGFKVTLVLQLSKYTDRQTGLVEGGWVQSETRLAKNLQIVLRGSGEGTKSCYKTCVSQRQRETHKPTKKTKKFLEKQQRNIQQQNETTTNKVKTRQVWDLFQGDNESEKREVKWKITVKSFKVFDRHRTVNEPKLLSKEKGKNPINLKALTFIAYFSQLQEPRRLGNRLHRALYFY